MIFKSDFYIKHGIKIDKQLISNLITGTAPLVISSTTVVDNLNADLLDGFNASDFVKNTDSFYIGETEIPLTRISTPQSLTGILSIDGSAASLTNARNIIITGDGNCTFSFDGSSNITASFTLSDSSVTPGTYNKVTVDSKGRITFGENVDLLSSVSWNIITNKPNTVSGYGITDAAILVDGRVPASQLPMYVDEIVEYTLFSQFPNPGSSGKIYLALDKPNDFYRWVFSPGSTTTGHYVDMSGLGSVVSADVLSTSRKFTIGNTFNLFNGSADVTWTVAEILGTTQTYIGTTPINILNSTSQSGVTLGVSVSGNAATATKLLASKNFRIGNSLTNSFDGTDNITVTIDELLGLGQITITNSETNITSFANGNSTSNLQLYVPLTSTSTISTSCSILAFHRAGSYATKFGLNTSHKFEWGGWNMQPARMLLNGSGDLEIAGNIYSVGDTTRYIDLQSHSRLSLLSIGAYSAGFVPIAPTSETYSTQSVPFVARVGLDSCILFENVIENSTNYGNFSQISSVNNTNTAYRSLRLNADVMMLTMGTNNSTAKTDHSLYINKETISGIGDTLKLTSRKTVIADSTLNRLFLNCSELYLGGIAAGSTGATLKINNSRIYYDVSSMRFKNNIRDSIYGLSDVLKLKSRMYEYKSDNRTDIGLIAEEVVDIVPELINYDSNNEILSLDYSRFVSILVKAVQELNSKLDSYIAKNN